MFDDHGADIDARNIRGDSVLSVICKNFLAFGWRQIWLRLLAFAYSNGATVDSLSEQHNLLNDYCADTCYLSYLGVRPVEEEMLRADVAPLQFLVHCFPETLDWIIDEQKREYVAKDKTMWMQKQLMQWCSVLMPFCVDRIVDIGVIFIDFPVLILVEICLYDQPCLRTIQESLIWDVLIKLKKNF